MKSMILTGLVLALAFASPAAAQDETVDAMTQAVGSAPRVRHDPGNTAVELNWDDLSLRVERFQTYKLARKNVLAVADRIRERGRPAADDSVVAIYACDGDVYLLSGPRASDPALLARVRVALTAEHEKMSARVLLLSTGTRWRQSEDFKFRHKQGAITYAMRQSVFLFLRAAVTVEDGPDLYDDGRLVFSTHRYSVTATKSTRTLQTRRVRKGDDATVARFRPYEAAWGLSPLESPSELRAGEAASQQVAKVGVADRLGGLGE